jgi:hypothetical protein
VTEGFDGLDLGGGAGGEGAGEQGGDSQECDDKD